MADALKKNRKLAIDAVKRDLIRSAAKKLFADSGLDGTSVREIARLAGYTTGAIYFHYANKEELYADILRDSLDRLFIEVRGSLPANDEPVARLTAAFRALVCFYNKNPRDLDLSLYLLNGARPRGLTPTLNRELNGKLRRVLDIYRTELSHAGIESTRLNVEVGGLFDEMIGSLLAAHTGRLKVIGTDLAEVVELHTANLAERLARIERRS
jgi:AcrR family transcriptional regulator